MWHRYQSLTNFSRLLLPVGGLIALLTLIALPMRIANGQRLQQWAPLSDDDDSDGLLDVDDPFAVDASNGELTSIPFSLTWPTQPATNGGILGLGFTGLMINGVSNYANQYISPTVVPGGIEQSLSISTPTAGDALGSSNNQNNAFQLGYSANVPCVYTAHTRILDPFGSVAVTQNESIGFYLGTGDQDNYLKLAVSANNGAGGISLVDEVDGVYEAMTITHAAVLDSETIDLYITVNPFLETAVAAYSVDDGPKIAVGEAVPLHTNWFSAAIAPAIGIISHNDGSAPFTARWNILEIAYEEESPYCFLPFKTTCINSGGTALMMEDELFLEDAYFTGGSFYRNNQIPHFADTVFASERHGDDFGYSFPLSGVKNYVIDIYLAEIFFGATGGGTGSAGRRVFDIFIEDRLVLDDYDLYAMHGAENAVVYRYDQLVTDGELNIRAESLAPDGANNAKISAICLREIVVDANINGLTIDAPSPVGVHTPMMYEALIETGGNVEYTWDFGDGTSLGTGKVITHAYSSPGIYTVTVQAENELGMQTAEATVEVIEFVYGFVDCINSGGSGLEMDSLPFRADTNYAGGVTFGNNQVGALVGTVFETERVGTNFQYNIPVPVTDTYRIELYFAEIFFGAPGGIPGDIGSRVFDIYFEEMLVEDNLDIIERVGSAAPLILAYNAVIDDGFADVHFDSATDGVDKAKLSAVCIYAARPVTTRLFVPSILTD